MNKILLLAALIPILVLTQHAMAFQMSGDGNTDGANAAREDWSSGAGMHAGCTDHGIDPTQNEGYCADFKRGYLYEWGVLTVVQ